MPDKRTWRLAFLTLGDVKTGKSCLVKRFCEQKFVKKYIPTIGIDYGVKQIDVAGTLCKINFWDTSGSRYYEEVRNEFYESIQAIMLVFDLSRPETFLSLASSLKEFKAINSSPEPIVIVIGNKKDLVKRSSISKQARDWANVNRFAYLETSCVDGENVADAFMYLFHRVVHDQDILASRKRRRKSKKEEAETKKEKKKFDPSIPYWASGSGNSNQLEIKRLVDESDRKWEIFSSEKIEEIRFRDVPWPLEDNVLGVLPDDRSPEKKRKFRMMTKRWHPDRFQMRFLKKLHPKDKERILAKVQEISKRVNHAKSLL